MVDTPEANLSKAMRHLNGVYTQAFNRRHGRVGHVLQGRFKAIIVDRDNYLLELCRYVVLNPVRAKTTRKADTYQWSSYQATAGLANTPPLSDSGLAALAIRETADVRPSESIAPLLLKGLASAHPGNNFRDRCYLGVTGLSHAWHPDCRTSTGSKKFRDGQRFASPTSSSPAVWRSPSSRPS